MSYGFPVFSQLKELIGLNCSSSLMAKQYLATSSAEIMNRKLSQQNKIWYILELSTFLHSL